MLVLSPEGLWLTDTFRHPAEDVNRYIPLGKQHGKDLKAIPVFLDWELILRNHPVESQLYMTKAIYCCLTYNSEKGEVIQYPAAGE